jgi:DNA-binding Lrp family transcriptional regulator
MKQLSSVIRQGNEIRQILAIPSTRLRVFRYILLLIQQGGSELPKQGEIAQACNTSRESVSRALNQLLKDGVAKRINNQTLEINPMALQAYIYQLESE